MFDVAATDWLDLTNPCDGHWTAIGDVHGRADLLESMFERIEATHPASSSVVLLGDLVDRGPESLRAIDLARAGIPGRKVIAIGGNHESMLLHAIDVDWDPDKAFGAMFLWARNGGDTVLEELGINFPGAADLRAALGAERVEFLESMLPHHRAGGVLFAHAGIDPQRSLAEQMAGPVKDLETVIESNDESLSMRWIRSGWVGYDQQLEDDIVVVYGHTIQNEMRPMVTPCQAGIDLGAYRSNILCASEVDHDRIRFHFVGLDLAHRLKAPVVSLERSPFPS